MSVSKHFEVHKNSSPPIDEAKKQWWLKQVFVNRDWQKDFVIIEMPENKSRLHVILFCQEINNSQGIKVNILLERLVASISGTGNAWRIK